MILAYDTETTGLSPYRGAKMFSYSLCDPRGNAKAFRLDGADASHAISNIKDTLDSCVPTMFNSKFDLTFTEKLLGELPSDLRFHDSQIMCHLLDSDRTRRSLKELAWELGGFPRDDEEAVKACHASDYSKVPRRLMDVYQEHDAQRAMLCHRTFWPQVKASPAYLDCYNWERRLIRTTMEIEKRGIRISRKSSEKLMNKLKQCSLETYLLLADALGAEINPRSPDELAKVLFKDLKMPVIRRTPVSQKPCVDQGVLQELVILHPHPALDLILRYRSQTGALSILESYLELADDDGILHPNINTNGARTGRESSSNPNGQNIQTTKSPRNLHPIPMRKIFWPRPGHVLFFLDYSGMEMRVLVHFSGDPVMTRAFREGKDPHILAAVAWYPDQKADPQMREALKGCNFAVHYGAAMPKIAQVLGLTLEQAKARRPMYDAMFPGARKQLREIRSLVQNNGCVYTEFGRKIDVPREKPYVGVSYRTQGTCADVLKRAQVRVQDYLKRETNGAAGIVLPIHDELVVEYPLELLPKAKKHMWEVARLMTDFPQLKIPLKVDCAMTKKSWHDAQDFPLE